MYKEFLEAVLAYVTALNHASESIDEKDGLTPYVNFIPVLIDNELCGFLNDEIGASYQYREATAQEREWWTKRPR